MYNEKVMELFKNPKHVGEIEDADGIGEVGNAKCGDIMVIYIKVETDASGKEIITDVSFRTFGCVAAITSSDVVCELAIGKTIDEALALKEQDVIDYLGNLPAVKIHCSVLGIQALRKAIEDYKSKNAQDK